MNDALINVNGGNVQALDILLLLTVLTLLPSLVVMMTSFTRFVMVFSFLRTAMGTQQNPPNMVLVGMALILTLFVMTPTIDAIQADAFGPYVDGEITQEEFFDRAQVPFKDYMLRQTTISTLNLYCDMIGVAAPESTDSAEALALPIRVILPAYVTSELKTAFVIGFLLYIPFLLIDIIVSSTLMSMGMVMLPPSMISTPFKILLFILMDGWPKLFSTLVGGIR